MPNEIELEPQISSADVSGDTSNTQELDRKVSATLKETVMDEKALDRTIQRMMQEILEANPDTSKLQVIGILRRGGDLAKRLVKAVQETEGVILPLGFLDIGFYRDDAFQNVAPVVHKTDIPFSINGTSIVLVDDVLFSGRTVRAALDALTDFGRPANVQLAVLVDRGHRELPIQADYVGKEIKSGKGEDVRVNMCEHDGVDSVEIWTKKERREK